MKHFAKLACLLLLLFGLNACQPDEEITRDENRMKTLLHQKRWQLIAMTAIRPGGEPLRRTTAENDAKTQDWYAGLPDCIKDNVFITEAPGTGRVGELGAEESSLLCATSDLSYYPHIAGWKINETEDIFSLTLFNTGHRMLYGYPLNESYHTENWMVEHLNEQTWQVRVQKVRDSLRYEVTLRFQALP